MSSTEDKNKELLAALTDPATYPHPVESVEHISTHISDIFLTGEYAYKLKKNITVEFLDFSTLDLRKKYCEREIMLNSRFAPRLYLEVIEIRKSPDGVIRVEGSEGEVIEYAVKMKQFPSGELLSTKAAQGTLERDHIYDITTQIADFHASAEQRPEHWSPDILGGVIEDDFTICERHSPDVLSAEELGRLRRLFREQMDTHRERFMKRQKSHVKALHGDLHLKNICIFEDKPTLFDGVEFNDEIACCDCWADFAFLLMDLISKGHSNYAYCALNRYLEVSDDYDGLPLLDFYIAYRALVRAMVCCMERAWENSDEKQEEYACAARSYLTLAQQQLTKNAPVVIAIGGFSGSGKSTLGAKLAEETGAIHIRSDVIRKHLTETPLLEKAEPSAYSEEMSLKTYDGLRERAEIALRSGKSVIIDAVHGREEQRDQIQEFARSHGYPFTGFWCQVSEKEAYRRLESRTNDPSDADVSIYSLQKSVGTGTIAWHILEMDRSLDQILNETEKLLIS